MKIKKTNNSSSKIRIGFDAKRYFKNKTGLGNYSRWVINNLAKYSNELAIMIYSPKHYDSSSSLKTYAPKGLQKWIKSIWRIKGITKDLVKHETQIYHGLSNELPFGIHKTKIKTVVTIHDLINKRYPHHYSTIDLKIYHAKLNYAQKYANEIVVPSEQTKQDLIHFFNTKPEKINVIPLSIEKLSNAVSKNEHGKYILCVSSFTERKNLVNLIKAFETLKDSSLKLIIAGSKGDTFTKVQELTLNNPSIQLLTNISSEHLNNLYQNALFCVYPSIFEGFGIPILEAFSYGKAVATSNISSMPEVGGNAAIYFNPLNIHEIAESLVYLSQDKHREEIEQRVKNQADLFTTEKLIPQYLELYQKLT